MLVGAGAIIRMQDRVAGSGIALTLSEGIPNSETKEVLKVLAGPNCPEPVRLRCIQLNQIRAQEYRDWCEDHLNKNRGRMCEPTVYSGLRVK